MKGSYPRPADWCPFVLRHSTSQVTSFMQLGMLWSCSQWSNWQYSGIVSLQNSNIASVFVILLIIQFPGLAFTARRTVICRCLWHFSQKSSKAHVSCEFWAHFLSLAWSKLRLWSANHRPGYWSNLPCDWPSTAWTYSEHETENGPGLFYVDALLYRGFLAPYTTATGCTSCCGNKENTTVDNTLLITDGSNRYISWAMAT